MKAYELIDSPEKWVNRTPMNDSENCAATAIFAAYDPEGWRKGTAFHASAIEAYNKLAHHIGARTYKGEHDGPFTYDYVSQWNDSSSWETVYETLKELDL